LKRSENGILAPLGRVLLVGISLVMSARPMTGADRAPSLRALGRPLMPATPAGATITPELFDLALDAASCAVRLGDVADPTTLTVIDYSKPSTEKRLWVFDLETHRLLFQELVAHGQGSGENNAASFSNEPETHRSSLGLFVTENAYMGKNGYSLRLNGLDPGFNDHARDRGIVVHGAPYVSEDFARHQGRLGRSWGCPALPAEDAPAVIDRIKGGGLLFAYYPDPRWLKTSRYLGGCSVSGG
jgi:hypothetical protein